jgi:folate-binding protein YgfZ
VRLLLEHHARRHPSLPRPHPPVGEDVRGFLQGLVTNDVRRASGLGRAAEAQGKCLFDFLVWADGDDLLLDCEAEAADELAKRLRMYRLRRPITIERDEGLAVCWSPDGPKAARPTPSGAWPPLAPTLTDGGASQERLWLRHRLSLGVCEGRAELGDLLWLECNAAELHGVSFTKGCYVGQENTARMNWRQKVNRRLVVVPAAAPTAADQGLLPGARSGRRAPPGRRPRRPQLAGVAFRRALTIPVMAAMPMPAQTTFSAAEGMAPFQPELTMKPSAPTTFIA